MCRGCQAPKMFLMSGNKLPWELFTSYLIDQVIVLGSDKKGNPITRPDLSSVCQVMKMFVLESEYDITLDKILLLFRMNKDVK
jgi:hypothetical protein